MSGKVTYAELILPLAAKGTFSYRVPEDFLPRIAEGSRVLVSFGKRRVYTAVVRSLGEDAPEGFTPKDILDLLEEEPLLGRMQLQLWEWMASYYMCQPGEVMRAGLPSGLRPESESRVMCRPAYEDTGELDSAERLLFEVVKDQGELSLGDIEITGITEKPVKILKQLMEKGALEISESVRAIMRKKTVSYIQLDERLKSGQELHKLLDGLKRAPRQLKVFERYLQLSGLDQGNETSRVKRQMLLDQKEDSTALAALLKKGYLLREDLEQLKDGDLSPQREPYPLSEPQKEALDNIKNQFLNQQTVLLHGVTSSGKTELYIHLIREQMKQGRQSLYLLPEIALTTQIIERIKGVFGDRVGIYHSRYGDSQRVHVFRNLAGLTDEEPYSVVIGVRSAVFLPFRQLGLVIVDEENESSYKQQDPAPRYHARDTAQVLALFHGARVLLGTATPSFESMYNAGRGKYGYVHLEERFGRAEKPELILANVKQAMHRKQMRSHFTPELVKALEETLEAGEQAILFQNRRGYAPYIQCVECGEIPKCKRCDVSLTFHRESRKLECHYCGYRQNMPSACPACGNPSMVMKGFGTEKLEDEIRLLFDGIKVGRLDADAVRSGRSYERVIGDFESGKLDVLIGTQMISRGLDFSNLSLVGIIDADSMLHFPDFRAFERSYQLMTQVSGRAGRRETQGRVIIQTMDPEHPVLSMVQKRDYELLFKEQMEERELFSYPPFARLIRISFRHRIPSILDGATDLAAKHLRERFSSRVLGPQYPLVRKVQQMFIKQILLKIEKGASYERAKEILREVLDETMDNEVYKSIRLSVDVDPY